MQITILGHEFLLLPQKALFWPEHQTLILADLHLGKVTHFRKAGMAIPTASINIDYQILKELIETHKPEKLLILGDLFHSNHNAEWQTFANFLKEYPNLTIQLVEGNHDILDKKYYEDLHIQCLGETYIFDKLIFTHIPMSQVPQYHFNFCGHIHPGFRLEGKARQAIGLPCFFQKENQMILPAFGHLTGLHYPNNKEAKAVYIIFNQNITKVI